MSELADSIMDAIKRKKPDMVSYKIGPKSKQPSLAQMMSDGVAKKRAKKQAKKVPKKTAKKQAKKK